MAPLPAEVRPSPPPPPAPLLKLAPLCLPRFAYGAINKLHPSTPLLLVLYLARHR